MAAGGNRGGPGQCNAGIRVGRAIGPVEPVTAGEGDTPEDDDIEEATRSGGRKSAAGASRTRHERVGEGEDGQRVDNFLLRRLPGVPKSHVYRLIRQGEVRVDGRRVRQTRRLVAGEQVRLPALRVASRETVRVPDALTDALRDAVLVEHADFLVVDKPAGVAVHAGSGLPFGLIDALRQRLDSPSLELVHRLDRGTSGALLVARDRRRGRALQTLFRERSVEKDYLALVDGRWPSATAVVDVPLTKNVARAGERRVVVDVGGQRALTRFSVVRRYPDATLLAARIETGRTHQIRVHARHAGHAVVGDTRYGDNRRNARFRRRGLARLFLHSARLAFEWNGRRVEARAPPGEAWERSLAALGKAREANQEDAGD